MSIHFAADFRFLGINWLNRSGHLVGLALRLGPQCLVNILRFSAVRRVRGATHLWTGALD